MDPNEARRAIGLPDGRWADVGGGPVHYREWPGHGPTFVLVHGLGGSSVNWALVAPRLAGRGHAGVVRETLALCAADPASIDPALVVLMVDGVRRRQDDVEAAAAFIRAARSIVRAQVRPAKYRELVRRADRPALVIHGGRDRLVPLASAIRAAERHPDWQLEVYPDLGHIPMMEAPARWPASVERWLDGIASGA